MKRTEYNLNVINNFILHYTHDNPEMNCDEMYQAAKDYIAEDHADGEEMSENENVIFFTPDMRNAFVAGEAFEMDTMLVNEEHRDEITTPDFGEWMEQTHNVKID